jgi:spermidine/putrescine transport system substrate-binding protein
MQLERAAMSRRELLRRSGGLGLAALAPGVLAACGGSTERSSGGGGGAGKIGGDLNFLSWQGYDLPGVMRPWQKAHGVRLHTSFINNHDDIQAKVLQNRKGTYDLISYYQGYHELYKKLGILSPLERDKVPNYEKNMEVFRGQPKGATWWESDGKLWGVPFNFGTWTLNYNRKEMSRPKKWTDLLAPKFKNRVAILDDPNGAIVIGARILGLPVPRLTKAHMDQIINLYREFRKNARTIAPSPGDLVNQFSSGEIIAVVPGYSVVTSLARDAGVPMDYIVPSEGSASFTDAWAIPPGSKNVETTHAWINHTLEPKSQAYVAKSLSAGTVQDRAIPVLDPAVRDLYPYKDLAGWFERAPLFDLPPEKENGILNYQQWIDAWTNFKSESG